MTHDEPQTPDPNQAGRGEAPGGALDRWEAARGALAARETAGQEEADADKRRRRATHDLTRGVGRGRGEAAARLGRERARDDASLQEERRRAERARAAEHRHALRALEQAGAARTRAEVQSAVLLERAEAERCAQREALEAARVELDALELAIDSLAVHALGSPQPALAVAAARRAVQRLDALLGAALLAEDGPEGCPPSS